MQGLAIAAYTLVGPLEYTINKYFSTYFTYATVDAVCCRVMLGDQCRECGDPGIYSAADRPVTSQEYLTSRQIQSWRSPLLHRPCLSMVLRMLGYQRI